MSWQPADNPQLGDRRACDALEMVIVPRARDLGGFEVRRALPSSRRQMVGPFIFWDQMGPAEFLLGQGLDVRPHPHIGLATVTYLFRGEVVHRDSLGTAISIRPGALNLMTAGRGVVHSERTSKEARVVGAKLFGIQAWVALPRSHEENEPDFVHYGETDLPIVAGQGATMRVIAGEALGTRSPVETPMAMIYADVELEPGSAVPFDSTYDERAIYTVEGEIDIRGDRFGPGQLLVFRPGDQIAVWAVTPARFMMLGGDPMDGPRHIWWNFVSSRKERIEQAKAEWASGRFEPVPGESDFIPLPEAARVVSYP
ncbi:MAG: pirin family protein [Acetobacteraceae bacterium]|nr:pirin family protein [Acetobacteraceae bacterium]